MTTHDWRKVTDDTFAFILRCRRLDGGYIPGVRDDLPDAHTLSWGHALRPGRKY